MSATIVEPATKVDSAVRLELRRLRDATGRISGSIFYGTMLRTMRESVLKGEHAAQLHGILAERMGASGQNPLAESLYRHLERQQAGIIRARLHGKGSTE